MINTKIINLLRHLTTRERTKFLDFVASPYFNKNEKLNKLLHHIYQYAPHYDHSKLSKRRIFQVIFDKEAFNELKINNLISQLLQLLYDFLSNEQFQKNKANTKHLLLEHLFEKEAIAHIEKSARRMDQLKERLPYRNHDYLHLCFQYHNHLDNYFITTAERVYDENLQLKSDYLDLYYFARKLRIACNMVSRNTVIKAEYQCHFLDELLTTYENNQTYFEAIPAIPIYYQTLQYLLNAKDTSSYFKSKALLASYKTQLTKEELWLLYNFALNYCIWQINKGKGTFYKEILDVYQLMLDEKIIYKDGYLSQWDYKNIVTAGLRTKAYDWTEAFMHNYKTELSPDEQENAFIYNLVALYYEKKDYKMALQQLHTVEFTDTSYHLGAKIIQLKSYYELDETEAFYALIEAFKKYVLRNRKIADYRKKANTNFLKMAKKIYQLKINKNTFRQKEFNQKLENINLSLNELEPLANKDWLTDIFEKLVV